MVVFQALTWEARDDGEDHLISIFGKTEDGKSVCVTTAFEPYFYIKLPDIKYAKEIYAKIEDKCSDESTVTTTSFDDSDLEDGSFRVAPFPADFCPH